MALRSRLIYIAIVILFIIHLLSYHYDVPDDVEAVFKYKGFIPKNPHLSLQRITMYGILLLFSYKDLVYRKTFLNFLLYSVSGGLMFNEIVKANQDWNKWIWIGFAITVLFPIFEYYKYAHNKK